LGEAVAVGLGVAAGDFVGVGPGEGVGWLLGVLPGRGLGVWVADVSRCWPAWDGTPPCPVPGDPEAMFPTHSTVATDSTGMA
jgi:hypothetical protein